MELYHFSQQTNNTYYSGNIYDDEKCFSFVYYNPMEIKGVKIGGKFSLYYDIHFFYITNMKKN